MQTRRREDRDAVRLVRVRSSAVVARAREVLLAACLGSALDADHFLAAGSIRLSRATALAGRPWGHSLAMLILAVRGRMLW